jgi:hypothetical protein
LSVVYSAPRIAIRDTRVTAVSSPSVRETAHQQEAPHSKYFLFHFQFSKFVTEENPKMKKLVFAVLCIFCLSALCMAADKDDIVVFKASLHSINENPPNSTPATGSFKAVQHPDGTVDFTLTFSGLATNAVVSHIHFGFPRASGGVMIFLCGGGGQPACPAATSGTVTGTITAANVTGPAAQGVKAMDLATALKLVEGGAGYVNVHDATFPAGEIRGQIHSFREDPDKDDK